MIPACDDVCRFFNAGYLSMKKQNVYFPLVLMLTGLLSCEPSDSSGSSELTLFSDTIDWDWELGEFYGGNSFYWWHNTDYGVVNLGEMPDDCWKTPFDFEQGHFYLRFELLEIPSNQSFFVQMGIWQNMHADGGHSETISGRILVENGVGSTVEADLDSPSTWWQLQTNKPVDFCIPGEFDKIGLALWKAEPLCLPMAQGWNNSQACENPEQAARDFFPMRARVTVVAVADGFSFSGWNNYP
jgi:hypothetical protein